jgi:hypothetical protein
MQGKASMTLRDRLKRLEIKSTQAHTQHEAVIFECTDAVYTSDRYPGQTFNEADIEAMRPRDLPPGELWAIVVDLPPAAVL